MAEMIFRFDFCDSTGLLRVVIWWILSRLLIQEVSGSGSEILADL